MIAVFVTIIVSAVTGLSIALAVDRSARGPLLIGLAILYGTGAIWLALMLLSLLHIAWTLWSAILALLAIAAIALSIARRRGAAAAIDESGVRPHPFDAVTFIVLAGFAAYASAASPAEWDFWILWGLKGRVFFEHQGIDWRFLTSQWNDFAHSDYPLVLPMNYAFTALLQQGWSDRWIGILFVPWAIAVLLIVRSLIAGEAGNSISAAATMAAAPTAASLYIGMAEGLFIAYVSAALLLIRRALRDGRPADWRHASILLGLAANCKNEGLVLIVVVAIGIAAIDIRQMRRILRLWPAALLATPWLVMRAFHGMSTDIVKSGMWARALERFSHPGDIFVPMDQLLVDRWSWVAILATLILVPRALARERFLVIVTFLQLAIYVAVYFVTPLDLFWHIATSWPRLPRQLELSMTVVCVTQLARFAFPGEST